MAEREARISTLLDQSMNGVREALDIYGNYVWPGPSVFGGEVIYGRILSLTRYVDQLISDTS